MQTNDGLARATTSGPMYPGWLRVGVWADFGAAGVKWTAGAVHGAAAAAKAR